MPPPNRADQFRNQIPKGIVCSQMFQLMREHRLLLGNAEVRSKPFWQTDRRTEKPEGDRSMDLCRLQNPNPAPDAKRFHEPVGTAEEGLIRNRPAIPQTDREPR